VVGHVQAEAGRRAQQDGVDVGGEAGRSAVLRHLAQLPAQRVDRVAQVGHAGEDGGAAALAGEGGGCIFHDRHAGQRHRLRRAARVAGQVRAGRGHAVAQHRRAVTLRAPVVQFIHRGDQRGEGRGDGGVLLAAVGCSEERFSHGGNHRNLGQRGGRVDGVGHRAAEEEGHGAPRRCAVGDDRHREGGARAGGQVDRRAERVEAQRAVEVVGPRGHAEGAGRVAHVGHGHVEGGLTRAGNGLAGRRHGDVAEGHGRHDELGAGIGVLAGVVAHRDVDGVRHTGRGQDAGRYVEAKLTGGARRQREGGVGARLAAEERPAAGQPAHADGVGARRVAGVGDLDDVGCAGNLRLPGVDQAVRVELRPHGHGGERVWAQFELQAAVGRHGDQVLRSQDQPRVAGRLRRDDDRVDARRRAWRRRRRHLRAGERHLPACRRGHGEGEAAGKGGGQARGKGRRAHRRNAAGARATSSV
jgi:hypothetical protein